MVDKARSVERRRRRLRQLVAGSVADHADGEGRRQIVERRGHRSFGDRRRARIAAGRHLRVGLEDSAGRRDACGVALNAEAEIEGERGRAGQRARERHVDAGGKLQVRRLGQEELEAARGHGQRSGRQFIEFESRQSDADGEGRLEQHGVGRRGGRQRADELGVDQIVASTELDVDGAGARLGALGQRAEAQGKGQRGRSRRCAGQREVRRTGDRDAEGLGQRQRGVVAAWDEQRLGRNAREADERLGVEVDAQRIFEVALVLSELAAGLELLHADENRFALLGLGQRREEI